ncbi:MAG: ABC transporter ATP-binding protein [Bacteroidota bacterium]
MSLALRAENISKKYILGEIGTGTISHDINRFFAKIRGKEDPYAKVGMDFWAKKKGKGDFWAIKDINFDVKEGEILGIIGKNGAGKSTLLKVLSKVTKPTSGKIKINGRIASLLEVGTGFHPELTGRENIFLNGAILGMRKDEIKKKFDAIVDFAGVGEHIDTPVKRYSSGMYVRLAFAVAAYLEPEILIMDEVLAVGDAEFQKKCLGKIKDVSSNEGRTVLFVSHNMAAVENICTSALWMKNGTVAEISSNVSSTISKYLKNPEFNADTVLVDTDGKYAKNDYVKVTKIALVDAENNYFDRPINNKETKKFIVEGEVLKFDPAIEIGYYLHTESDEVLYCSFHYDTKEFSMLYEGKFRLETIIPNHLLNEGVYKIYLVVGLRNFAWFMSPDQATPQISFEIKGGLSDSSMWLGARKGYFAPVNKWQVLQ